MNRLRVVKLIVQPVLVMDDGETLTELTVQPLVIVLAELDGFPAAFRAQLAEQEAQLNQPPA